MKASLAIGGWLCAFVLIAGATRATAQALPSCLPVAQPGPPGGVGGGAARPPDPQEVVVPAIPGLTAGGAWTKVVRIEGNNADGIVSDKDGNILSAAEDNGPIMKIDANGHTTDLISGAKAGSLSLDRQGRLWGILREPRPGTPVAGDATRKAGVVMLTPQRKVWNAFADGTKLSGRPADLAADGRGGAFFAQNGGACLYYAGADGTLRAVADKIRIGGLAMSPDDTILYLAVPGEGALGGPAMPGTIVAFDVTGTGTVTNRRTFATLESGNGDSLAVDADGRLWVPAGSTVQVFDKTGKHVGTIPAPGFTITVAFGGPDRKTLYMVREDVNPPTAEGGRQVSRTFFKLPVTVPGLKNRGK